MERKNRKLALWMIAALLALTGCGASGAAGDTAPDASVPANASNIADAAAYQPDSGKRLARLGASLYAVELSEDFVSGSVSNEDWEDDMVAYYENHTALLDFAVYRFSKEGYAETLEEFVREEAEEYDATEIVTDASVNGVPMGYYRAVGAHEGAYSDGVTYAFEDGDHYIELDFWFVGQQAEAETRKVLESLTTLGIKPLSLGSYSALIPEDFAPVERDAHSVVYCSGNASLTLRVRTAPGGGAALEEFVRKEAAARNGSDIVADTEVNGLPAASYRSMEASDGAFRSFLTYVFPDGGEFVSLSFRLDGIAAEEEAEEILQTLSA